MRFQSKYRTHKIVFKTTLVYTMPGQTRPTIDRGVIIEFEGPQRIFDSEIAAQRFGWDNELKEAVEDFILKHKHYGNGIYLAAGQELPQEKLDIARVKPKELKRFCAQIGFDENGDVEQCKNEPSVGRKFCAEHDPDEVKITRGLSTTLD